MWPTLKDLLVSSYGLDPNATDEQAVAHLKALSSEQRAALAEVLGDGSSDKLAALVAPPAKADAKPALLRAQVITDEGDTTLAMEGKRVAQLRQLGQTLEVPEHEVKAAIARGDTVIDARKAFLRHLADAAKPVAGLSGSVSVGEDANVASLRQAIPQAILLRAGVSQDKLSAFEAREAREQPKAGVAYLGKIHDRALQLRHLSLTGMFKAYLRALGATGIEDLSAVKLAELMGPRAMRKAFPKVAALAESTSDFGSITLDAFNKSLRFMYLDAARTWDKWAARGTAPDFKNINRVVLSESPSLVKRNEGGEIKYVQLTDSKEVYSLSEYVGGIRLTRRAIVNDDLDAFNQIPRQQANAAARLEDDVAYAILTNNAAMADTGLLFNATAVTTAGGHANYTASDAAPSIATIQTGWKSMKKQKGLGGAARLELTPKFLLVPTSIEFTTEQLINSEKVVAAQASGSATPITLGEANPFYKRLQVIGSTRLDDISATAWYLAADYRDGQVNTVEVAFLTDEPEPVIRQETDFDTEDVKFAVRHTVAAQALDYRGLYKSNGA